jgi:transcriptional regulator with XRE-family HTH domain
LQYRDDQAKYHPGKSGTQEHKMLKEYLKRQSISVYALAKRSGVPYSTLNDLANGKVSIDNCKVGILKSLSDVLGMSMEDLYNKCLGGNQMSVDTDWGVSADISVRNKSYYVQFVYNELPVEIELCKVNRDTTRYIDSIAKWRAEGYIRDQRMKEHWDCYLK